MKKIVLVILITFFITGCGNTLKCSLSDDKFKLVFQNGKIVEYYDSSGKSVEKSVMDEMNTYLKNVNDDSEAMKIIEDLLNSYGGECN